MHLRPKHWHQLNHIIVRRRQLNAVKSYRSMHSADCDTDHALVRCTLKLPPKKIHSATPKLNTELMRKLEYVTRFCGRIWGLQYRVDDLGRARRLHLRSSAFVEGNSRIGPLQALLLCSLADKHAARLSVLQDINDSTIVHYRKARNNVKRLTR